MEAHAKLDPSCSNPSWVILFIPCNKYVSEKKKNAFEKLFVPFFSSKPNFSSAFLYNHIAVNVSLCFPPNNFWMCLSTSNIFGRGENGGERGFDVSSIIKIPEMSSKLVAGKRKETLLIFSLRERAVWGHTSLHTKKIYVGEHHYKLQKKGFYLDRKSIKLKTQIDRK